jgi:hypothetical protein
MCYIVLRETYAIIHDFQITKKTSIARYDGLFAKQAQNQLRISSTIISKHRQPESLYLYEGKYHVMVYSVLLSNPLKVANIVNYIDRSSSPNLNADYGFRSRFNYDMTVREGGVGTISKVNFRFSGDLIRTIVNNDSLLCYYYKFKTFSINYDKQGDTQDLLATAEDSTIPADIEFIRKDSILYILILTTANGKEQPAPDLLYNITKI